MIPVSLLSGHSKTIFPIFSHTFYRAINNLCEKCSWPNYSLIINNRNIFSTKRKYASLTNVGFSVWGDDGIRSYSSTPKNSVTAITVGEIVKKKTKELKNAGVSEARISVECIVAHTLGYKMLHELGSFGKVRELTINEVEHINEMCLQKIDRVPLQYILGEWDFRNLTLIQRPPVFIVRPETEMFVTKILEFYDPKIQYNFLELCCGSGCITVSLLKELPMMNMIAIDILKEAATLTMENAQRYDVHHRLKVFQEAVTSDLPSCLSETDTLFDAMVSNPPYLFTEHLDDLEPEITLHEAPVAFDGGVNGTDIIRDIIKLMPKVLKPRGHLWMEVDFRHPDMIYMWLKSQNNLPVKFVRSLNDYTARPRYVVLQYVP